MFVEFIIAAATTYTTEREKKEKARENLTWKHHRETKSDRT